MNETDKLKRQEIINLMINDKRSARDINGVLKQEGLKEYNPLLEKENYRNLWGNLLENAENLGRDMRTYGGAVAYPVVSAWNESAKAKFGDKKKAFKKEFQNQMKDTTNRNMYAYGLTGAMLGGIGAKNPIGVLGGGFLGTNLALAQGNEKGIEGIKKGGRALIDAVLSTYGTSVDDIKEGKFRLSDAVQGAFYNPLYAGMDFASPAFKGGKYVADKANIHIPKNAPLPIQQILPSRELRDLNRNITSSMVGSASDFDKYMVGLDKLQSSLKGVDREKIVENIVTNKGGLNPKELEIASEIKRNLNEASGVIPEEVLPIHAHKTNVVSQYVVNKIDDPSVLHDYVYQYINRGGHLGYEPLIEGGLGAYDFENRLKFDPKFRQEIDKLVNEGIDLQNKNEIAWLTQALTPTRDPLGNVIASDIAKTGEGYFGTRRVIGKTKSKDLAKRLEDSIDYQLGQINKVVTADKVVKQFLNNENFIKSLEYDSAGKPLIPKGYVALDRTKFIDSLGKSFMEGKDLDLSKALQDAVAPTENAIAVSNVAFTALKNAMGNANKNSNYLSTFKRTILARPRWFVLNRVGNLTNNSMEGVRTNDYFDAISSRDIAPNQLKRQTSYSSYSNEARGENLVGSSATAKNIRSIVNTYNKFNLSPKSLKDYAKLVGDMYNRTSNLTSSPIYKAEAKFEFLDRYANFIRQAKRLESKTGKNWKDIVKEAGSDQKLFNSLNNEVNKSLGDYLGRNWALPNEYYQGLSWIIPFYRFLNQTARTTGRQMVNRPLEFANMVTVPTRLAEPYSENIIQQYGLDRDKYRGGIPYSVEATGDVRTLGIEPLPIGSVAEDLSMLASGKDWTSMLSPLLTSIPEAVLYTKNGRTPTSSELNKLKLTKPSEAENYTPSTKERLSYLAKVLLGTTHHGFYILENMAPELYNSLSGGSMRSKYDTSFIEENPLSYKKTYPSEMIGKWLGIISSSNYPKRKPNKYQVKKDIKKAIYNMKRMMQLDK